jgi:hypothetical protein
VGKPEVKRPLGRLKNRWEDLMRMDLGEIGLEWSGVEWSGSSWLRIAANRALVNTVMDLVPRS